MDKVYLKSRYNKGEAAYLNCPMTEEEFNAFHEALVNAEVVPLRTFEKEVFRRLYAHRSNGATWH